MTAISPYAPVRRQSSLLSNASGGGSGTGGGRMLRRRSSTSVVANATLLYTFVQYWRRIMSRSNETEGGVNSHDGGGSVRVFLNTLCELVSCHLTVHDNDNHYLSTNTQNDYVDQRRGITSVLRWLVTIIGGDRSILGKLITIAVGFTREMLVRSITAANVVLTGLSPKLLGTDATADDGGRIEEDAIDDDGIKPVLVNGTNDRGLGETINGICSEQLSADTIRNERTQIDQVLNYWFGRASPDGAQKSLWMIASSSVELLNQVDSDISDKFRLLVLDLAEPSSSKVQRWTEDVDIFGWQGKMAAIIALDQMSRHIHRYDKNTQNNHKGMKCILPEQKHLDAIAYDIATKLQRQHKQEVSTGIIPIPMRIFGIMPLRHASTAQDLGIVQQDVEASSTLHEEMDRMIRRFRKATNRRMAALQDEARREGKLGLIENNTESMKKQQQQQQFDDEQILECFPFKADMSKANENAVVKTMSAFLTKMKILQLSDARFKSSRRTANTLDNKKNNKKKSPSITTPKNNDSDTVPTAIISLSGGVDSMVIASALAYLRDTEAERRNTTTDKVLHIVGIHIDYGNRPESGAEAAYVGRYCKDIDAKFICRKIDEVKRGVTSRDDYERIAREIRFSLYRQCSAEASNGMKEGGVGIMLGHHRGDLRENVISNAHKGCGPLDLSGMTSISKNDGVTLFRPLLSLEKSFIYDYSHTYGVPYFKDTTPHWSTRGKLRNRLIPLLEEIYGEGSMDNLSSLAEESDDARALIQQTVMGPFMEQVKRYPMGITFETSEWKDCGLFFWKVILRQVVHSAGLGMFRLVSSS